MILTKQEQELAISNKKIQVARERERQKKVEPARQVAREKEWQKKVEPARQRARELKRKQKGRDADGSTKK